MFHIGGTEFELNADGATLRSAKLLADIPDSRFTGNTTTEHVLTCNGGMQGKSGETGRVALKISGCAEYTEDVVAAGKAVSKHRHREQAGGELDGMPD
nr:hypothetical protein [Burkholderia sp. BCC1644]